MMQLRRFNQIGIEKFEDALDLIGAGEELDLSLLLQDPDFTNVLLSQPIVEVRPFNSRFSAAQYFYKILEPAQNVIGDVERDRGLWSWLAAAWLDVLAPRDDAGKRKLGARARWIPVVDDYTRYYRHLLAGPYRIYRAHRDDPQRAMGVLATPIGSPGEVVEQLVSRQEIVTSPSLMEAVTRLYYAPAEKKLKRGAGGKGGGSARRLVDVIQQFDLTWDVYGMDSSEFVDLLPHEFDRFKA